MGSAVEGFKLCIISASLFVKKVRVAPSVRLGHTEVLLTDNAKYSVGRVGMKVFSIPAGSRVSNQENLFLGQLPKMLVLGFVDNDAFRRSYAKNPFHFKHYNINFVALYVDGEQIPTKPLQPDFEAGHCVREYMNLVQTAGKHMKDRSLLIDREEFAQGYTSFAFDLSPDQECANHYSLIKTGNLRAEIRFGKALTVTVNMIVYGVFDYVIEIIRGEMFCLTIYECGHRAAFMYLINGSLHEKEFLRCVPLQLAPWRKAVSETPRSGGEHASTQPTR
ncbi:uncharacterized protein F54H12.2-like [Mauremys mutica]|uniref:uncharacterized protein F54H12.2-like n=1 Tax=Mauremys mutica TaxID=74926 RepID=UPI001D164C73|nr:uncharacterized protein F54H12.2-like [Mauremys mutica]